LILPLRWRFDNRRQCPRAQVQAAWATLTTIGVSSLFDISVAGASLEAPQVLSNGTILKGRFLLEGGTVRVELQVRHVTWIAAAHTYRVGVRFIDLQPEFEAHIEHVVHANLSRS